MTLWKRLAWRRRRDEDLRAEIASHVALSTQERIAHGQDPETARRAALKEFGNVTLTREATRLTWGGLWIDRVEDVLRDARYAVRLLVRSPAYALIVIAVLALGIGTNVIAFALFKALALTPLPGVADATALHFVYARARGGGLSSLSYPDYRYLRDQHPGYSAFAGASMQPFTLALRERQLRLAGEFVTGNYFETLGVGAQRGRTILPSDEINPGGHPVVVISDDLWRREFGADPDIVGKPIRLNAFPLTIVGVADPDFRGAVVGIQNDVFVPVTMLSQVSQLGSWNWLDNRENSWLQAFARPRAGVTLTTARAQTDVLAARLAAEYPLEDRPVRAFSMPFWESPYGAQTYVLPTTVLISAMSALLLVVVCVNVAGLVLVRGMARRGELAARLALGASRARLVRLLLMEHVALALPGAYFGLLVPQWLEPLLAPAQPDATPLPLYFNIGPDGFLVAFAVVLALVSGLLYGLWPSLRGTRIDLASVIKDGLSPQGGRKTPVRTALVVCQVAMSFVLLVGTSLIVRSLEQARRADPGFDPERVGSIVLDVKAGGYDEAGGRRFYRQLLEGLRADPGIEAASMAATMPLTLFDYGSNPEFTIEGHARGPNEEMHFFYNVIAPDYFRALRIGLLAGRDFNGDDDATAQPVTIVNETMARRFWGDPARAVGKRIRMTAEWRTVIGVVKDIKYARINEDPRPYVYLPFEQMYLPGMTLQVRAPSPSSALLEHVRSRVGALDPNLSILEAHMLTEQTRIAFAVYDVSARVLGVVGLVAIGLAALGIYGLLAYTVKQRTHEIGIRLAVGAQRGAIVRQFLRMGLWLGVGGAAIGVALALVGTRLMASLLFGVSATDALSFALAAGAVLLVALLASLIPAWWGARTDPLVALRHS
jgi:putative ABC transport system permease protein